MKIWVTGMGVVSAIGSDVSSNLKALQSGRSGIVRGDYDLNPDIPVGRVYLSSAEMGDRLKIKNPEKWPRTALLGLMAASEANVSPAQDKNIRCGFINGTTTGGMDRTEKYFGRPEGRRVEEGWSAVATHDLGTMTRMIGEQLGTWHYLNTISTACSSAANGIMMGARLIRSGALDRVLVGGCDALTSFTINGFRSLMIYDQEHCKPFDDNRKGLNLGEGAGYLLLENDRSRAVSGNAILASLTGWANANDAHHQTATSPEGLGAKSAMQKALEIAGLKATDIDYLNAHGTATQNNDQSELAAIEATFDAVDFSSTKGLTGHTLGAAGGIEAVFSVLSLLQQQGWPNFNKQTNMAEATLLPVMDWVESPIEHVMSNSFGFGGNSTSLIFSKT